MDRSSIETEELGTTIIKKQMNYLDDCNTKFKKKKKITKSNKRAIIENILINGFKEFISISEKEHVDDECSIMVYFFIHGLRDSIKTDAILEKKWETDEEIKKQIIDFILTLSQYMNTDILKLKNKIIKKSKKYFPHLKIPFKINIFLRKVLGNRKLINTRA